MTDVIQKTAERDMLEGAITLYFTDTLQSLVIQFMLNRDEVCHLEDNIVKQLTVSYNAHICLLCGVCWFACDLYVIIYITRLFSDNCEKALVYSYRVMHHHCVTMKYWLLQHWSLQYIPYYRGEFVMHTDLLHLEQVPISFTAMVHRSDSTGSVRWTVCSAR